MSSPHHPTDAPADGELTGAEDAAAPSLPSEADLRALLAQARASDDARLRQLVTSYVTLRQVTRDVVAFIAAREGGAAVGGTPILRRARALVDPKG